MDQHAALDAKLLHQRMFVDLLGSVVATLDEQVGHDRLDESM